MMRLNGKITMLGDYPELTPENVEATGYGMMTPEQIGRFERRQELDFAFTDGGRRSFPRQRLQAARHHRLGSSCHSSGGLLASSNSACRRLSANSAKLRQGLVLVTGPTGCGKSTTLAAIIDLINRNRRCNIVTIEDPIEFVHRDKKAIINQREIGIDTDSFTDALKYVVRQSPDVILIGEMRDVETMNVALAAAETGHLVFSTVHTTSAAETMDRIMNMFPPHDKPMVCMRLSGLA